VAPSTPTKLALGTDFDWVVGCKLALKPEFCCPLLTLGGANATSSFAPPMLRPIAVKGVPPGDAGIVLALVMATKAAVMAAIDVPLGDEGITLAFAETAAVAAIVGGGDGVCDILALLRES
jgi:hypothetical protein